MPRRRPNQKERRQTAQRDLELRLQRRDELLSFARELTGTWAIQITNEYDCTMRFIDRVWHQQVSIRGRGSYHYSELTGDFESTVATEPLPTGDWALLVRLKRDFEALLDLMIKHRLELMLFSNQTAVKRKRAGVSKSGEAYYVDFREGRRKLIKPLLDNAILWIDKCVDDGLFGIDLAGLHSQCAILWRQQLGLPNDLADLCLDYMLPDGEQVHQDYELDKIHGEAYLHDDL